MGLGERRQRALRRTNRDLDPLGRGDDADADRLALLDRLGDRVSELNLDQHEVVLTTLPDGGEALLVDGGGIGGGNGIHFANYGDDVHAVGSLARPSRSSAAS